MQQAVCQNCTSAFTIEDADIGFYRDMQVPLPTFCPACRFQRRLAHINTRNLYPRSLKPDEAPVISMYSQDKEFNVVNDRDWHNNDHFDFFSFGKAYDFEQSFFAQFRRLWKVVPLPHLQRAYATFENSDYCNAASELKNCYLMINADNIEECMYGFVAEECKFCVDFSFSNKSELCYEAVNLENCYGCLFCDDCENCNGLQWCQDCVGCTDCFGCIGLRHKKNHLFNVELSKEDYEREMAKRRNSSWCAQQKNREECRQFFLTQPRKGMKGRNNESVDGDYIYQSRDVHESFMVKKAEHCKFGHFMSYITSGTNYAYDYTMFGVTADHMYECSWCGLSVNNLKFCIWNYGAADMEYCIGCHYSKNLFGCIGLRHKQYCILNKQYTQAEYEKMLPLIKQQMMRMPYIDSKGSEYRYGEFFPVELSPFDYNQTLAREFSPLTKTEVLSQSYGWHETKERPPLDAIRSQDLPDHIQDITEGTVAKPILCKAYEDDPAKAMEHHCTQYFKIIPQELAFYKRMGLALPKYCHNSRHFHRLQHINPFRLWDRPCGNCGKDMQTTYAPDRPETVLCDECYLAHVY